MAEFVCFTRNWYKWEMKNGYKKLVAHPHARRIKRAEFKTREEAVDFCTKWNEKHAPGILSNKCEFTSDY